MDVTQFWELIEKTHVENDESGKQQATLIRQELVQLPVEEIIAYEQIFYDFFNRAEHYDLRDAASFIGAFGDSGWKDFRGWLIGQGQKVYDMILADPDSLADIVSVDMRFEITAEWLLYTGQQAYEIKTGNEDAVIPYSFDDTNEPVDRRESLWKSSSSSDEYDHLFAQKYPKIWAKFNE